MSKLRKIERIIIIIWISAIVTSMGVTVIKFSKYPVGDKRHYCPNIYPEPSFPRSLSTAYLIDTIHISEPFVKVNESGVYITSETSEQSFTMYTDASCESDYPLVDMTEKAKKLNKRLYRWRKKFRSPHVMYRIKEDFTDSLYLNFEYIPEAFIVALTRKIDSIDIYYNVMYNDDYELCLIPIWSKSDIKTMGSARPSMENQDALSLSKIQERFKKTGQDSQRIRGFM